MKIIKAEHYAEMRGWGSTCLFYRKDYDFST